MKPARIRLPDISTVGRDFADITLDDAALKVLGQRGHFKPEHPRRL
jgi:hypothetical protein